MRLVQLVRRLHLPVGGALGFPVGFLAAAVVTMAAVAAHATAHPLGALVPLTATTAVVAATSTFRAAVGTAAVCWALHSGFVLNRRGDLSWTTESAQASIILATAAAVVSVVAAGVWAWRRYAKEPSIALPAQRVAAGGHWAR